MCSISRDPGCEECTICTVIAPDAVFTVRRYGDTGQLYGPGAVSALITALALGGVVISLLYQARDVSATRSQAIRTFQFELLRTELEDADLMWASGAPWGTAPDD